MLLLHRLAQIIDRVEGDDGKNGQRHRARARAICRANEMLRALKDGDRAARRCRSQRTVKSSRRSRSVAFAFAGRDGVGWRIWIDNIRARPLANVVGGEQTFNGGKAGQVA
jgi:hypothetical protein